MRFRTLLAVMAAAIAVAAGSAHATAAETSVYKVWFQRSGKLWLVKRQQPLTSAPARAAMQALLAGPNLSESDAGVGSQVPASADLLASRSRTARPPSISAASSRPRARPPRCACGSPS